MVTTTPQWSSVALVPKECQMTNDEMGLRAAGAIKPTTHRGDDSYRGTAALLARLTASGGLVGWEREGQPLLLL